MKVLRIFIPGRFEDSYVYMQKLICITEEHTVRAYDLGQIVGQIQSSLPSAVPATLLMFLRNDWLEGTQLNTYLKNKGIAQSLLTALDAFPQPHYEFDISKVQFEEAELNIRARVILDIQIYNSRLYLGSDAGLFNVDLDLDAGSGLFRKQPVQRLEVRCVNASAKYGVISASCGNEGLFAATDEFGSASTKGDLSQVASRSLRTSWMNYDLVNYVDQASPVLLTSKHKKADGGLEREHNIVTEIGVETIALSHLFARLNENAPISPASIQYSYNSNNTVFLHTTQGMFYAMGIHRPQDGQPTVKFTKTFKGEGSRILSAHATKVGFVIETDNRVFLFANGDWTRVLEGDAISVRTFVRSKRFQNIAAITREDGVLLAAFFDDSKLE